MLAIFELLSLIAVLLLPTVVDSASIKIMGSVDHGGSSRSKSQIDTNRRKQMSHIVGKPGHQRIHSEDTIEKMISENPGAYLYEMLMSQYNVNILPVNSTKSAVEVRLLFKLTQIVDVDEKNQIMTTNLWLHHEWYDHGLKWDPKQFGGIETLYIPCEDIWLPDTILYNNADGDYQITIQTKVAVRYDGLVVWEPPAIYKSFCFIDVEFFPYDTQLCDMKFGPWTFDVSKVNYLLMNSEGEVSNHSEMAVDISGYYDSVEWDVLKINGTRKDFQYPCCEERYVDITYNFYIRRKTLFYTINLIIPCIMISFLTVLVFYLPCQSGEKVALSISTLLSLTWFILLLSEIIPPTSLALPLMGKYLLFTMVLVTLSIAVTVLVLYNHFRHPYAFAMPSWVRYVFLEVLPKLMFYTALYDTEQLCSELDKDFEESAKTPPIKSKRRKSSSPTPSEIRRRNRRLRQSRNSVIYTQLLKSADIDSRADLFMLERRRMIANNHASSSSSAAPSPKSWTSSPFCERIKSNKLTNNDIIRLRYGALLSCHEEGEYLINEVLPSIDRYFVMPQVREALKCVHYITGRYRQQKCDGKLKGDWEAVSRVLDRFFLIVFSVASSLGTCAILLMAPSLYDPTPAMQASDPREIFPTASTTTPSDYDSGF